MGAQPGRVAGGEVSADVSAQAVAGPPALRMRRDPNVLLRAGSETLAAKTVSTVVATSVAFVGNRFWTWRHREHHNMARQYTTFFVLNAVGLGIGLACLTISHYGLGLIWPALQSTLADNVSGRIVGTALGTLFRFWSYRRFVFRAAAPVPDRRRDAEPTPVPRM